MNDDSSDSSSPLEFPCDFPIKIVGKADLDFQAAALSIIRRHIPNLGEAAVATRYSKGHKYLSLTVIVHATSREQLDTIYRELTADPQILMVL